jgi:hypothetical protein
MITVLALSGIVSFMVALWFGVDWLTYGEPTWKRCEWGDWISKQIKPHFRRIKKAEKDAQQALEAIQNLHETKKKINAEYKDNWTQQYRLLLPPPPTPKRKPVHFRYPGDRHKAFPNPIYDTRSGNYVEVDGHHSPVPVGAIQAQGGNWWYGFNNLPGHPNELVFIRVNDFHTPDSNAFHAFIPTIYKIDGEYTWSESKAKALATNIKDTVLG